jgi:hypothetical protein
VFYYTAFIECLHMGMTQLKFVTARQAGVIHMYKNLKHKILKCKANIQLNKECLKFNLIPKYANTKKGFLHRIHEDLCFVMCIAW